MTDAGAIFPTSLDTPEIRVRRVSVPAILLTLFVLGYAIFLFARFAPALSEPDDNGYWAQASLMYTTGHTWFVPQSDAQYIGMHWLLTPSGQYVSRYPPGLPALVGLVYKVAGYKAAVFVNPALGLAALVGMYLLCARVMSTGWAFFASVMLGMNPTFAHHALSCDSHTAVTFCLTWGLYFLLSWSQDGKLWRCFVAGLILGCIPTIRYPDSIVGGGIALFLLLSRRSQPRIWLHWVLAGAGAAIPILPLLIRNQLLLGAFWRTGYALTNEQTGFGWDYFKEHALEYIQQIHSGGMGLMFALGIFGIAWMCGVRKLRPTGIMLALITAPMLLLYMAYYWAPQFSAATMRFLLPTFPAYVLAGAWAMAEATKHAPRGARVAASIAILSVQLLWGVPEMLSFTRNMHQTKQSLALVTDAIDSVAAPGDVVLADQQLLQHLDYVRKWKLADQSTARGGGMGMRGPGGNAHPDAPSPQQSEKRKVLQERYTGTQAQRQEKFAADIATWADGHKIYIVGVEREVMRGNNSFGTVKIVKRITLPEQPKDDRNARGNRFGGPGGGGQRGNRMGGPGGGGPGMGPPGGGPPGGGGPMGMGFLDGQRELVVAEWTVATR